MSTLELRALAYPGVVTLVAFLAYSSQYLFTKIEPGALRRGDAYIFNTLVAFLLICYTRTCFTDPGRVPRDWQEIVKQETQSRWCRRCDQPKPPRSHHCKTCNRCVPKMDHHCIWTANCVSHITYPHFIRFLSYSVASMVQLEYFLFIRCAAIWEKRDLPSYLGPSVVQLTHLFILVLTNSVVLLALSIMLGKTLWDLASNTTTIEGWEIERHQSNVRRADGLGGYLYAPDGSKVRIEQQEYPWDIGIFQNVVQGMGTWNPLSWLSPFARSPSLVTGLRFEHNQIEDPSKPWPPPDPDRMFRAVQKPAGGPFRHSLDVESFKARQAVDLQRHSAIRRRHETAVESEDEQEGLNESWRNSEGEQLADFGVDEDVEFYDEDIPLAELIRQRQSMY